MTGKISGMGGNFRKSFTIILDRAIVTPLLGSPDPMGGNTRNKWPVLRKVCFDRISNYTFPNAKFKRNIEDIRQ
jgi:hypothetical protein